MPYLADFTDVFWRRHVTVRIFQIHFPSIWQIPFIAKKTFTALISCVSINPLLSGLVFPLNSVILSHSTYKSEFFQTQRNL